MAEIVFEEYTKSCNFLSTKKENFMFPNVNPKHADLVGALIIKDSKDVCFYGNILNINYYLYENIRKFVENPSNKFKYVIRDGGLQSDIRKIVYLSNRHPNLEVRICSPRFSTEVVKVFNKDINFICGDSNGFRVEKVQNDGLQSICSFNRPELAKKLLTVFNNNFEDCCRVNSFY